MSDDSATSIPWQPKILPPLRNASLHNRRPVDTGATVYDSESSITPSSVPRFASPASVHQRSMPSTTPFRLRPSRAGIYATSTSVQQDTAGLEVDLEKIIFRSLTPSRQLLTHSAAGSDMDTEATVRRGLFLRHSKADLLTLGVNTMTQIDLVTQQDTHAEHNHFSVTLTAIMDTFQKHRLATQCPSASDVLNVLSLPFYQKQLELDVCTQALDVFDYMHERFNHTDRIDNFEYIMFCCRILEIRNIKLKMRLINTLKLMLDPEIGHSTFLPSSGAAFQALVYTLVNALASTVEQINHEEEIAYVQTNIRDILDKLAVGKLIPIEGAEWNRYYKSETDNESAPESIAHFYLTSSLCRSLMSTRDKSGWNGVAENNRDQCILQDLLPTYWKEPDEKTQPAYLDNLFLLCEAACDIFLNATIQDLNHSTSTAFLMLQFIQEKIIPSRVIHWLKQWSENDDQRSVASSIISMLLSTLSITNIAPRPASRRTTPTHSPRPSTHEFITESGSLWTGEEHSDHDTTIGSGSGILLKSLKEYTESFWKSELRNIMLQAIQDTVQDMSWGRLTQIYENLAFNMEESMSFQIVSATLPVLFERLSHHLPPVTLQFSKLLFRLSDTFRHIFFKPVIACVATDDQGKVAKLLTLITCLSKYLSGVQLWMHDAEMINVILLSEVGKQKDVPEGSDTRWGSTTLGQCVVATEFLWAIKDLRSKQKDPLRNMEEDEVAKKFLIDLERRLSVYMTAKEKTVWIPIPLRVILCNIFSEIRFFCNTTHRPGWLTRAVEWAVQPTMVTDLSRDADEFPGQKCVSPGNLAMLNPLFLDDVVLMFERIQIVYAACLDKLESEVTDDLDNRPTSIMLDTSVSDEVRYPQLSKRRQQIGQLFPVNPATVASFDLVPPPVADNKLPQRQSTAADIARHRLENMDTINQDPLGSVFSLLVAVFTSLGSQEFDKLVAPLWEILVNEHNPHIFVSAAFLLMHCGEKAPLLVVETITHDFYSDKPTRRFTAIQKLAAITGFRFNILAQDYIPVSSRKRPFRGDGGAFSTPFVPTDLGSNRFTMDEPRWMTKLKHAGNFPVELKRQIQELGWDDDDQGEEHEALKKVLTPLALLPSLYLETEDEQINENEGIGRTEGESRQINFNKMMTRRKQATTVHAFTMAHLSMVDLLNDNLAGVSSALRELIEGFLRDDPELFLRPFLSELGKCKMDRHRELLTRIRYLVDIRAKLPPGFTYILFNYLAGMLKWITRENKVDGMVLMTLIHPILAELVLSTNELSIRDLRKNKIEHLLASTGRFWFTNELPVNMFPRCLTDSRTSFSILDIPWDIFSVATLRTSHIQFLTNFLARYPREVYAIKKTLQSYEPIPIPGKDNMRSIYDHDAYFPDIALRKYRATTFIFEDEEKEYEAKSGTVQAVPRPSQQEEDVRLLSALRARVWLRFIDTLLGGLNKNYNDRAELERIVSGVNTIIMDHHHDFGIIGLALTLYTRIATRFKRLFTSSRGYSSFLPALFKVYCEAECLLQIRSAITFAWCRFYAVHEESFVFQMLSTLVPLILDAYDQSPSLGGWMTNNLYSIMQAMSNPPRLGATSDVLGLQLQVELDDHERGIHERIDAASNPMAMPLSTSILKPLARSVTMPIIPLAVNDYSNRPFPLQSFVKLFLTIIAYDPGSLRAEQFVKMLRHLLPRFIKLSNLRQLMSEGVSALVDVFTKFSKANKPAFATTVTGQASAPYVSINIFDDRKNATKNQGEKQRGYGKQWQQNDRLTIKKEFVFLVHQYFKCQGTLSETSHGKMVLIIRSIMRDSISMKSGILSTDWIRDYMVDMCDYDKPLKAMLTQIGALYKTHHKVIDGADFYQGMAIILEQCRGKIVNVHDIAGFIRERFIPLGISIAIQDWEQGPAAHDRFCHTLVQLILAIMENTTQDIIRDIEDQTPSVLLISKIVIPLCLHYDINHDHSPWGATMGRSLTDLTGNWMRLIGYISKCCSQTFLLKSKSAGFSLSNLTSNAQPSHETDDGGEIQEPKHSKFSPEAIAQLYTLSLIAVKIILIRGAKSFDKVNGSWVQVAYFIKSTLMFGQTLKSLKTKSTPATPRQSPSPTPRASLSPTPHLNTPVSPDFPRTPVSPTGDVELPSTSTLYDYALWSFIEFILFYKSPLILYLRDFIEDQLFNFEHHSNRTSTLLLSPIEGESFQQGRWMGWGSSPKSENAPTFSTSDKSENSPTCGLGLNLPLHARRASSLSVSSEPSHEGRSASDGLSPKSSTMSIRQEFQSQEQSSVNPFDKFAGMTYTAIDNIQLFLGRKPPSSWAPRNMTGPWAYSVAVKKMISEWQYAMDLQSELTQS